MAKLFTITEGLENLGALKSGGQGSVYKGRRVGEILSAVKLLPTPIVSEDPANRQFMDFQNEVNKLKKVNEQPNPNVVRILGSGVTETGGFPFIEMEFIEGPDLCELLQKPHDSIFTIRETIRVAEHLSNALAHCHQLDVKHGDVKSNNVKFNRQTGHYVLLDFGLAMMSDEQRRTSLRHAGAIEFMAPEQNEGKLLFQSDVYSFGIIIFELLTGRVPFPLEGNTETGRNQIMLAHMEAAVPDLMELRKSNLPDHWPEEKKNAETEVPTWLTHMICQCLEKLPENRFRNGHELHEYVCLNKTLAERKTELDAGDGLILQQVNSRLQLEKQNLQEQLADRQQQLEEKEKELVILRNSLHSQVISPVHQQRHGVSKGAFSGLIFLSILLASIAAYGIFFRESQAASGAMNLAVDSTAYYDSLEKAAENKRTVRVAEAEPEREIQNQPVQQQPDSTENLHDQDADSSSRTKETGNDRPVQHAKNRDSVNKVPVPQEDDESGSGF